MTDENATPATGPPLAEYRKHLVAAAQKAQDDFDKALLSLSGGALGVSFAFVKDIVGAGPMQRSDLLLAAWITWGVSIVAVLASFLASQQALVTAIGQVDAHTIYTEPPGRAFRGATIVLNVIAGTLFLAGVILVVVFVGANLANARGAVHTAAAR